MPLRVEVSIPNNRICIDLTGSASISPTTYLAEKNPEKSHACIQSLISNVHLAEWVQWHARPLSRIRRFFYPAWRGSAPKLPFPKVGGLISTNISSLQSIFIHLPIFTKMNYSPGFLRLWRHWSLGFNSTWLVFNLNFRETIIQKYCYLLLTLLLPRLWKKMLDYVEIRHCI